MSSWTAITDASGAFLDAARSDPGNVLVALDFDGTLAPIVDDPEQSSIHPDSAAALAELGPRIGHLAIITGRPVEAVRRLGRLEERDGLDRLVVLGQYGVERWDAATGVATPVEEPENVKAATAQLQALLADLHLPGVTLEHKGRAVGVHTRRSAHPEAFFEELKPRVAEIAGANSLVLEPGRLVLELRASSVTKGDALRGLIDELGVGTVAMCGDDLGDLPAFALLSDLRGAGLTTCRVVSGSLEAPELGEQADVLAEGPAGVARWLKDLADGIAPRSV